MEYDNLGDFLNLKQLRRVYVMEDAVIGSNRPIEYIESTVLEYFALMFRRKVDSSFRWNEAVGENEAVGVSRH